MDRERSPAFVVLPKTARRMLGTIEAAIGDGGSVTALFDTAA
jgi:hypothetical protein